MSVRTVLLCFQSFIGVGNALSMLAWLDEGSVGDAAISAACMLATACWPLPPANQSKE